MKDSGNIGLENRLTILYGHESEKHDEPSAFAKAVAEGLNSRPKHIPCRFFYDSYGSELFEQITGLPEYYLTRSERAIFETWAPEIVEAAGTPFSLVELGSGSSKKTRYLIEAALEAQGFLEYLSIDIAADYLEVVSRNLLRDYPGLQVTAIAAEYLEGLSLLPESSNPRLFLFLGSNLGNFDDAEAVSFLSCVQKFLNPEDALLVGIDFAKDHELIEPAYNDAAGVTEAFNKNLLRRINLELGGDIDSSAFKHEAAYKADHRRIEMHLVSLQEQAIWIPELGQTVHFAEGESIHTESCRKYTRAEFAELARASGLLIDECWTDDRGWFGLFLVRPLA